MRRWSSLVPAAVAAEIVLLGLLTLSPGLSAVGWAVGSGYAVGGGWLLVRAASRSEAATPGPADLVTLTRAVLIGSVAALAASALGRPAGTEAIVGLAAVALLLDAVDGRVARRTRTASAFGARFDMEADAVLIAVLSVLVASQLGWWVACIGAARYALLVGTRVLPWLAEPLPPRYWAKVVAALQGIALTVAVAGVLPAWAARLMLLGALALLTESFARQVWELWWRHRGRPLPAPRGTRTLVTGAAVLLVWLALVLPTRTKDWSVLALGRLPIEAVALVALALLVRERLRRVVAVGAGLALGVVALAKLLDLGFSSVLDRPFDPVNDWSYLGPGFGVLSDSVGRPVALVVVALAIAGVLLLLAGLPWATRRLLDAAAAHRRTARRWVAGLTALWVVLALTGAQLMPGLPVASSSGAGVAVDLVGQVRADLADRQVFASEIRDDAWAATPPSDLLTRLRGKDVLLVFVESYGRVAVQGSSFSPGVVQVLDDGTARLATVGFDARSAFLTSPTFGAASWLAHSSLQSGLWVDSQRRYNQLMTASRSTLTSTFARAGWRTVFDVPAITHDWPEGPRFYGFDRLYDSRNVGYAGPRFSYATMPDQYTLAALDRLELAPGDRPPVMAEVDLVSSHHPWAPLPSMVPWDQVGDGSVFDPMPARGDSPEEVFADPDRVKAAYGASIEYTLSSLISYVETHPDPDLVLIVLGDHQPHSYVSGDHPGHDVPISIIAHDPAVLEAIGGWGWSAGLRPDPGAPAWPMSDFRDRFLTAYR